MGSILYFAAFGIIAGLGLSLLLQRSSKRSVLLTVFSIMVVIAGSATMWQFGDIDHDACTLACMDVDLGEGYEYAMDNIFWVEWMLDEDPLLVVYLLLSQIDVFSTLFFAMATWFLLQHCVPAVGLVGRVFLTILLGPVFEIAWFALAFLVVHLLMPLEHAAALDLRAFSLVLGITSGTLLGIFISTWGRRAIAVAALFGIMNLAGITVMHNSKPAQDTCLCEPRM